MLTLTVFFSQIYTSATTTQFSHQTNSQKDLWFYYIDSAEDTRRSATVQSTKAKWTSAWQHWNTCLHSIGIGDIYLDRYSRHQKNTVISGFAQAVRIGIFSKGHNKNLVEGTVTTTVVYVAQTFRANSRNDPIFDSDGKTCFMLQEQYRGYRNTDGSKKTWKSLQFDCNKKDHRCGTNT